MKVQRRQFLGGVSAAVLAGCGKPAAPQALTSGSPAPAPTAAASAVADAAPIDGELVDAFLAEGLTEGDPAKPRAKDVVDSWDDLDQDANLKNRAKKVVVRVGSGDLVAKVPEDALSPDFIHFTAPDFGKDGQLGADEFVLTGDVLRGVADVNGYGQTLGAEPLVIFGLRGCVLKGGDGVSASGTSIAVREAKVDHVRRRCVVGVWDTKTGLINAYAGSTVPNLVNMQYYVYWRYYKSGAAIGVEDKWTPAATMACLLPQGLHAFRVGVHLRNEPAARQQPGALLQDYRTPILRSATDVGYTIRSEWDPLTWKPNGESDQARLVGVNIHAGVNHTLPPYASKGCQTIFGWYDKGVAPEGLWKQFQTSLGIAVTMDAQNKATFTRRNDRFPYLLTTGRDARLQAAARQPGASADPVGLGALTRVRLGSKGAGAAKARGFLAMQPGAKLKAGDEFDGDAMLALLQWQRANNLVMDGVITPQLSKDWKIDAI